MSKKIGRSVLKSGGIPLSPKDEEKLAEIREELRRKREEEEEQRRKEETSKAKTNIKSSVPQDNPPLDTDLFFGMKKPVKDREQE